jgi:methionyl aminopeptidase
MIGVKNWKQHFEYKPLNIQNNEETNNSITKMIQSAELHKQVRYWIQKEIKIGADLFEIVKKIESTTKFLSNNSGLNGGIGFPCGVSKDNCAAHYSPSKQMIINDKSIYKIDFGTHVDGYITDSAFSITFNEELNNLIEAGKDATYTGIKIAGCDQIIGEWGEAVQEVMESYQVTLNGKTFDVKPIRNLGGHNVERYKIHGGQLLLSIKNDNTERMESNTAYAIETFATTGDGWANINENENNLFALNSLNNYNLKLDCSKKILYDIKTKYKTLPIVDRWFEHIKNYKAGIKELSNTGYLFRYPPLYDTPKSYISQFEHTIWLSDSKKIILSQGDDY